MTRRDGTAGRTEDGQRWRRLEELSHRPEFVQWVRQEFPDGIEAAPSDASRRDFLRVMAASFAFGGLAACRGRGPREIVPYATEPDHDVRAGRPTFVATAVLHEGFAHPVLVESHMGRPIKVEGNPDHPESLGATDVFAQASVLRLYDPDRSRTVLRGGDVGTWRAFAEAWSAELPRLRERRGAGFHLLTGRWCSPTLDASLQRLAGQLPDMRWYRHEPVGDDAARAAARRVLGQEVALQPRLAAARRVLSLAADFLFEPAARVQLARDFAAARRCWTDDGAGPLRLYAVEPTPTLTGANADHRLAVRAAELPRLAARAAHLLGVAVPGGDVALDAATERWLGAAALALREAGPRALVLAGLTAPAEVHAIALAMNAALGALGSTLVAHEPADRSPLGRPGTLADFVAAAQAGEVEAAAILGTNPVYTAPGDLDVRGALRAVRGPTVHAGEYVDETARECAFHLPFAHELECWQDARSPGGRATILQPLIEPLHDGRAPHVVAALLAGEEVGDREAVQAHWAGQLAGETAFAAWWQQTLLRGFVADSAAPAVVVEVDLPAVQALVAAAATTNGGPDAARDGDALELVFRPDDRIWDGRHANNAWLQELPKPLTKLTWDNAAVIAPAFAERLALRTGDVVRIGIGDTQVLAPVQVLPGQPDRSVAVALGHGRRAAGRVGDAVGFDAYPLRSSAHAWHRDGVVLQPTGSRVELAHTQHHQLMEGRDHVRRGTLQQFRADPALLAAPHAMRARRPAGDEGLARRESLLPEWRYEGQQWGMAIDLSTCIGCGACTIACQAENNIPVVGKQEVLRGREMHWIRVDCWFDGEEHAPGFAFQPVPCMHCEKAPCELVCPVGATQHSHDGLNDMIYNRCIGTRYCSNNCPYKVRRFNFLAYTRAEPQLLTLRHNPEVTVRSRGVMEKCTYCVQRIRRAEIVARTEDRAIRDGEIATACQQVCPAQAIVFGDIADPDTAVSRWKKAPHGYGMLADLGTQPRTTYLAAIRDPDPTLARGAEDR